MAGVIHKACWARNWGMAQGSPGMVTACGRFDESIDDVTVSDDVIDCPVCRQRVVELAEPRLAPVSGKRRAFEALLRNDCGPPATGSGQ